MEKKRKNGLQIRFNSELEPDVIEFFTELKKAEIHITAISAFRMYMKSVGFYEKRSFGNKDLINMTGAQQTGELAIPPTPADNANKGHFDKKGFQILSSMFDDENDLKN